MNAILTCDQDRNERRMRRLREYYTHTLSPREHVELIERGEAIRREWHSRPIPENRALTVISRAEVQSAPVAASPCDAAILAPSLPASEQQAPIPEGENV